MTLDTTERESIIRLEEQLKESGRNLTQILSDLRDIFNRLEHDSKTVAVVSGDLKGHCDNSRLRWDTNDRALAGLGEHIKELETKHENLTRELGTQKQEFENLRASVKSSTKMILIFFTVLNAIGAVIGSLSAILQHLKP